MSLSGRTALITGATRGIGRAIALKLAEKGANVVVTGRTISPHRLLEGTIFSVAEEINSLHGAGRALACALDVRNLESVKNAISSTVRRFDSLDILVNNCSAVRLKKIHRLVGSHLQQMFDVNLVGSLNCIRESLGHLAKSRFGGHVVNLSPPLDCDPRWGENNSVYSITKLGQSLLTLGLSSLLSEDSVAINSLWSRNVVATPTSRCVHGGDLDLSPPELMADALLQIILRDGFSGNFVFAEDLMGTGEESLMPSLFSGDPEYSLARRQYLQRASVVSTLFGRINKCMSPQDFKSVRGRFSIVLEDMEASWSIDCDSPHPQFRRDLLPNGRCQLVMTASTVSDIINKDLTQGAAEMARKVRVVGDRGAALSDLNS